MYHGQSDLLCTLAGRALAATYSGTRGRGKGNGYGENVKSWKGETLTAHPCFLCQVLPVLLMLLVILARSNSR